MENTVKINTLIKILGVKKRTIIFWCDEFEIQDLIFHSNGGNKYSKLAVFVLTLIKILKDSSLFSSAFINLYIKELRALSFNSLPELPSYLDDLSNKLKQIYNKYKENRIFEIDDSELNIINELDKNNPKSDEMIIDMAEAFRKNAEYDKAYKCYELLYKKGNSKYSEISKIFMEIIKNIMSH